MKEEKKHALAAKIYRACNCKKGGNDFIYYEEFKDGERNLANRSMEDLINIYISICQMEYYQPEDFIPVTHFNNTCVGSYGEIRGR